MSLETVTQSKLEAVVKIPLTNGLGVNINVTDHWRFVASAAIGPRSLDLPPLGRIHWQADGRAALAFLNKLNSHTAIREIIKNIEHGLKPVCGEIHLTQAIHHISPVEFYIYHGDADTRYSLSRNGYIVNKL